MPFISEQLAAMHHGEACLFGTVPLNFREAMPPKKLLSHIGDKRPVTTLVFFTENDQKLNPLMSKSCGTRTAG